MRKDKNQKEEESIPLKRGDIFHDGILGFWVLHEKPKGKELMIVPLEKLKEPIKEGCSFWHKKTNWNLSSVSVWGNIYEEPELEAALKGKGNILLEVFTNIFNQKTQ